MPVATPPFYAVVMILFSSIVGAWIWVILRLALRLPILPPATSRKVPWGAGSVLAVFVGWLVLNGVVSTAYFKAIRPWMAGAAVKADQPLTPGELMAMVSFQNLGTLVLIPLILSATSGARARDFGLVGQDQGRLIAQGLVTYPLLAPVVYAVMGLSVVVWGRTAHPVEDAIAQNKSPSLVALSVLAAFVLAPLAEELIFRGVLLGWLTRIALGGKERKANPPPIDGGMGEFLEADRDAHLLRTVEIDSPEGPPDPPLSSKTSEELTSPPLYAPVGSMTATLEPAPPIPVATQLRLLAANVAVSIIFAALHGKVWPTPIPIFFLSLGLGFLYQRSGSLIPSMALHMIFNGVSTLLMFLTLGNAPAPKPAPKGPPEPPVAIAVETSNFSGALR